MKRDFLRQCLIGTCISFTVELLAFCLLPDPLVPLLNRTTILQTFVICVCCSFAALIPFVWIEHMIKALVLSAVQLLCVLFGIGIFIFDLIPFDWGVMITIVLCCIVIYVLCSLSFARKDEQDADLINRRLEQRRNSQLMPKKDGEDAHHAHGMQ